jgi:predicted DNA-binding antitoxin AbrB/MazE fold protein
MSTTFTAIYEHGVLRPLLPLSLPEHAAVELRIVPRAVQAEKKITHRQQVYEALQAAGLIKSQALSELATPGSEAELTAAAKDLALAGPISELIIAERAESY